MQVEDTKDVLLVQDTKAVFQVQDTETGLQIQDTKARLKVKDTKAGLQVQKGPNGNGVGLLMKQDRDFATVYIPKGEGV